MTHLYASRRPIHGLIAIFGLMLVASSGTAEEKAVMDEHPRLIEQALPKSKTTKYDLRYKMKRGEVLRYEVTDHASFTTTIEQSTQAAQTKTVTVKSWKITDVLPDGNIEFINVVERVKMLNQLPDRDAVEYDSVRDKTPPPGFEDVAKSVGVPLSAITMTSRGKVVRREKKQGGQNAEESAPIVVRLPDEPVAIGDTWDEPFDVEVTTESGASKSIQTRRHHKLANVANGIATIEVTYQILSPIDAAIEYQLVQRLVDGEVRFDIHAGRVMSQQMDIDKRILGFAGPTSSVHYVMRMEEKLLPTEPKLAGNAPRESASPQRRTARSTPTRTTNRSRSQQSKRSYRR